MEYSRCVAYGILPEEEAEKVYKKVLKRKKGGISSSVSSPARLNKKKKKGKVIKEESADPGMQVSGGSGIGISVI